MAYEGQGSASGYPGTLFLASVGRRTSFASRGLLRSKRMLSALARRPRAAGALARALAPVGAVRNHCQVPCGIFDDPAKVSELKQDAATIRKAMVQTNELGTKDALSLNQVRPPPLPPPLPLPLLPPPRNCAAH